MRALSWEDFCAGGRGGRLGSPTARSPLAAAIGVFDGLHIGHTELIRHVLGREGLVSAVVTFNENPKRILRPASFHGDLSTLDQKLSLIDSLGVDLCVLIDFSGDFSKLPGRQFLSMLRDGGNLHFLAVGSDFRCGYRLDTDAEGIRRFCADSSIGVELLHAVPWAGHPVSSSRIRRAILEGRMEDAESMLGRPFEIDFRGGLREGSGRIVPAGGQASPPPGHYEAALVRGIARMSRDAGSALATLDSEGGWSLPDAGPDAPPIAGLRLIHLVSRE